MNLGPYTLVGEIGRGGMGVVLKATNSRDGRFVAIKLIRGEGVKDERSRIALVREAGATASLRHRNIVSIYDVNQYRGNLYIVMEFLEGASLERLILRRWPLELQQRLEIIVQLCEALAYAHEQGVVHRDIKPANIFILHDGTVKVLDFGVAAVAQISGSNLAGWGGTIPYMSPEQVNRGDIDGRSDIWSAGVTLFQLIAGNLPFTGKSASAIFEQILDAPVPQLPKLFPLSNELDYVLLHALHKEREKRYSGARLLAEDLRQMIPAAKSCPWTLPPTEAKVTNAVTQATLDTFSLRQKEDHRWDPSYGPQRPVADDRGEPRLASAGVYQSLDLGFARESRGNVVITSGRSFFTSAMQKVEAARPIVLAVVVFLVLIAHLILVYAQKLNWSFLAMLGAAMAAVWLGMSAAIAAMWLLEKVNSYARCPTCRLPMWRRSVWTRFVKSNAEVVLGYRDCVAALQSSFWEDAAKLLCIHGAEYTSPYASRSIERPLRYNLEFYECGTCVQRAARLTTDGLVAESWLTRPEFVQANQGAKNQTATSFRTIVRIPRRMFFICQDLLRETRKIRFNERVAAFSVAACLILIFVAYNSRRDFITKTTGTARLVRLADNAYFGFGEARNLPLAAEYYKKAAGKGDVESANRLAEMLEHGMGVSVDLNEALRWYQFAAIHGNARAQYNLGRIYENGIGVPVDQKKALRWYLEAANQGNQHADYSLGTFYENGIGVQKDQKQAMAWYRNAARLGNVDAQNRLLSLQLQAQGANKER
jgi:serine/threonine protein kinase